MTTMRLFVGLELPESVRRELQAASPAQAPGIRPIMPEQMHITLHFLGNADVEEVQGRLARVDSAQVPVAVCGAGRFTLKGGRAILWAGVSKTPELLALHASCGRALAAAGIGLESRRYVPHVTFARLKSVADRRVVAEILRRYENHHYGDFTAERFVLYRSVQQEHTHHYEVIAGWPLR